MAGAFTIGAKKGQTYRQTGQTGSQNHFKQTMLTTAHVAVKPSPSTITSEVNTTFIKPVLDVTDCAFEYEPDSSASCLGCEQAKFVHWNTLMMSLPASVLSSVKLIVMSEACEGAMTHAQFALFEYGESPEPSEKVPF